MWTFESRRTGWIYKANEIGDYMNQYIIPNQEGDSGDLVLRGVWTTSPSEIRLDYILNRKLPAAVQTITAFNDIDCKSVTTVYAEYLRHWFRVVCTCRNGAIYLLKFTLTDGSEDCNLICDKMIEFKAEPLKGFWRRTFGWSAEELLEQIRKAWKSDSGQYLRIPSEFSTI